MYNITTILDINDVFSEYSEIDGYKFIGWNSDKDGNGDFYNIGYKYQLYDNLNLYARFYLYIVEVIWNHQRM